MKSKRIYYIFPFVLVLLLTAPFLLISKQESVLIVNHATTLFLDRFFKTITWFGEGFMICIALFFVIFLRLRWFMTFVVGLLIHLVLINANKHFFFPEISRPLGYFTDLGKADLIRIVDGVTVHFRNSFPSGHTTGATFGAVLVALIYSSKRISFFLAIIAMLVGYSRMYLGQHFFVDVYFGYFFGIVSAVAAYYIVKQMKYPWLSYHLKILEVKPIKRVYLNIVKSTRYHLNSVSEF